MSSPALLRSLWLHLTIASLFYNIFQTRSELSLNYTVESVPDATEILDHSPAVLPFIGEKVVDVKINLAFLGISVICCKSLYTFFDNIEKIYVLNVYSSFINIKAP